MMVPPVLTLAPEQRRSVNVAPDSPPSPDLPTLTAARPILLSDDEPMVIELLQLMLERGNLYSISTTDPFETLQICRESPVSLVISDMLKPGMGGLEMLERLRADPVTARIPFIFLTACCGSSWIEAAWQLGADDYLTKPILPREFLDAVQCVLLARGNWQDAHPYLAG
ncbi:MAG: response regulator [Anaerolineae bacterium]|nr:response regulator [Anaerolineae bacterium]